MSNGAQNIQAEIIRGLLQFLQADIGIVPKLGRYLFLPLFFPVYLLIIQFFDAYILRY
jgi:hypothetical protein